MRMAKGSASGGDRGGEARGREVVVVTGASAGVGRAVVREFARRGAWVGLIARGRDGLAAARREVEEMGGRALELVVDVADADAVEAAAERVERELGAIDVWVNNAMVTVLAPAHEMEVRDYRRVTEVNYLGTVHGTLAALRRMRARDRGVVVQVGSALAYRAIPLQSSYCASKFAIRGFTDALRSELLHEGSAVHLTMVQMPALNTPQFDWCKTTLPRRPQPVPPIYQPEVAAEAVWFAAHARRREVWVGRAAPVIAGNKVLPGLGDRYLARTGYDAQQSQEPIEAGRRDNLYEPVPGDAGAHGRFDAQATGRSLELWASEHKGAVAGAVAGVAAVAAVAALWRRRR